MTWMKTTIAFWTFVSRHELLVSCVSRSVFADKSGGCGFAPHDVFTYRFARSTYMRNCRMFSRHVNNTTWTSAGGGDDRDDLVVVFVAKDICKDNVRAQSIAFLFIYSIRGFFDTRGYARLVVGTQRTQRTPPPGLNVQRTCGLVVVGLCVLNIHSVPRPREAAAPSAASTPFECCNRSACARLPAACPQK